MGNIVTFCFCSACTSLLTSCCGSDKNSTIPPSATSGRKRSVFLLMLSIVIALIFQYAVAPKLQPDRIYSGAIQYLVDAWSSGCGNYENAALQLRCSENSGVYRVASSAALFFTFSGIAAWKVPTANRDAWAAKILIFLMLVVATIFIPNDPLFSLIMVNIFRVGAVFFIIFQHVIFVDMAFNLNESWVAKADKADIEEGEGRGKKWLYSLLAVCVILFTGSIVFIGLLYKYFGGCAINLVFISATLSIGLINTVVQLCGEEASLFTSAAIFSYSTYLCYVALSQNPDNTCNPTLKDNSILSVVFGIGLTALSLLWTGWSYTAHKTVNERSDAPDGEESEEEEDNDGAVSGIVISENYGSLPETAAEETAVASFSNSWKLNVILILITCWYAVALTGWGSVELGGNSANPSVGKISMWMVAGSQWLMGAIYLWTLMAPKFFPDRDFS